MYAMHTVVPTIILWMDFLVYNMHPAQPKARVYKSDTKGVVITNLFPV